MNKKLVIGLIIIVIVIMGVLTAHKIKQNEKKDVTTTSNNINANVSLEDNILPEENQIENETEKKEENSIEENNTQDKNDEQEETETNEDKAKRIVKENWGEDTSVYFSYDGIDSDGNYIICVREQSSTKALSWYYVNVQNETFEIKN